MSVYLLVLLNSIPTQSGSWAVSSLHYYLATGCLLNQHIQSIHTLHHMVVHCFLDNRPILKSGVICYVMLIV